MSDKKLTRAIDAIMGVDDYRDRSCADDACESCSINQALVAAGVRE